MYVCMVWGVRGRPMRLHVWTTTIYDAHTSLCNIINIIFNWLLYAMGNETSITLYTMNIMRPMLILTITRLWIMPYTLKKYTIWIHRAGLNRGVPMGRSTKIMGGSFRRGLNSKVVTFSTRLAVQPSPLYKSNGEKSKMAASYFCILPSDWP